MKTGADGGEDTADSTANRVQAARDAIGEMTVGVVTDAGVLKKRAIEHAISTLGMGLRLVDGIDSPETMEAFDVVYAGVSPSSPSPWDVAAEKGQDLTPALVGAIALANVLRWNRDGATRSLFLRPEPVLVGAEGRDGWLVRNTVSALEAVAELKLDEEESDDEARQRAIERFIDLALVFGTAEERELELAASLAAVNFVVEPDETAIRAVDAALKHCIATEDSNFVFSQRHRKAVLLAKRSLQDPRAAAAALDELESVIRHLPPEGDPKRAQIFGGLAGLLGEVDLLKPLAVLLMAASRDQIAAEPPDLPPGFWYLARPTWDVDVPEVNGIASDIHGPAIELENKRLALLPEVEQASAETSWTTFSFRHPTLERAIPHISSILRERDLDEYVLTIAHEVTHVLSLLGDLARPALALRAATGQLEFRLWSSVAGSLPGGGSEVELHGVAPLHEPSIPHLAFAELELDLTLKLQAVERLWAPWFEGIAVFAELAADPTLDEHVSSPVAEVIANLVDENLRETASDNGWTFQEAYLARLGDREAIWSDAIGREGVNRLHVELGARHRRYLPGYLAVRSVVSAWRRVAADALPGPVAFRLLLHATRMGTDSVTPNLATPLPEFRIQAEANLHAWMLWLARLSADELRRFFAVERENAAWRHGHLLVGQAATDAQNASRTLDDLIREAYGALDSAHADSGRVGDVDARTVQALTTVAEGFDALKDAEIDEGYADRLGASLRVLPISELESPFWLIPASFTFLCLLRTTYEDRQGGGPKHQVIAITVPEESFRSLEHEVSVRQMSRMRVARVADLSAAGFEPELRGYGLHHLAFVYGGWFYIEPRGFLFDPEAKTSPTFAGEAHDRLSTTSLLAFDIDRLAGGRRAAERTRDWIDRNAGNWDSVGLPIEPWAEYVRGLADDAATEGDPADVAASAAIAKGYLEFAVGEGPAADLLASRGLVPLADVEPLWVREVVRALDASARTPYASEWLDEHAKDVADVLGPIFVSGPGGWDVAPTPMADLAEGG